MPDIPVGEAKAKEGGAIELNQQFGVFSSPTKEASWPGLKKAVSPAKNKMKLERETTYLVQRSCMLWLLYLMENELLIRKEQRYKV